MYETGAAVYVYFGFGYWHMSHEEVVKIHEQVEAECRDEIIKNGGCISHHHGVGKVRKRYVKNMITPLGITIQKGLKDILDPKNIFAINNTVFREEGEEEEDLKHIL